MPYSEYTVSAIQQAQEVSFNVNGEKIDKVSEFKYLGRILEETDDDEHAAN